MITWILVAVYVLGMFADYTDSRGRHYFSAMKSLIIAPFWPVTFAIGVLLFIIRLPQR